jgi:hypothetical protein
MPIANRSLLEVEEEEQRHDQEAHASHGGGHGRTADAHDTSATEAQQMLRRKAKGSAGSTSGSTDPGGQDALGRKENLLLPFYQDMVEVAAQLAGEFAPLGLHFRPQILMATAMQEAANKNPLTHRSFDNGLGIMQITPYKGRLDASVAKAIGWDNTQSIEHNIRHSRWRDARANLLAGGHTMLAKARALEKGAPAVWAQMDEPHRWRAVLFAYNAGQGAALSALRRGGPDAAMISTYTYKGKRHSHDYTAELQGKLDYVETHDPGGRMQSTREPDPDRPRDRGKSTAPSSRAQAERAEQREPAAHAEQSQGTAPADRAHDEDEHTHVSFDEICKNPRSNIPGSRFRWHDALWLPRWSRHVKPSDITNTSLDTVLSNIARQAAALDKICAHLGRSIVVHCWLRPPAYNKLIGGASNSAHLRGLATDFHVVGMSAEAVRRAIKAHKDLYPGAGENSVSWVHLDLEHSRWFNP